jgi:hypothetical protein
MLPLKKYKAKLVSIALAAVVVSIGFVGVAFAQSGHFLDRTVDCTDIGTQVECTGKVAGLGGTTFEITIEAAGIATVECTNPGGNVAPGQDTTVNMAGTTDPLPTPRNGQFQFTITSDDPEPLPPTPTCPNEQWTPNITDVTFTNATLTLLEDGMQSDVIPDVPVRIGTGSRSSTGPGPALAPLLRRTRTAGG